MPQYIKQTEEKFPQLTRGLKKVADFLLSDPVTFAIHPAKKLGELIDVSETMVIRFCHAIGYEGFSQLQQSVRNHLLTLNKVSLQSSDPNNNEHFEAMTIDMQNIKHNIHHIDTKDLEQVVNIIINADRILVAGYYHSFTFAHWFYFNLNYVWGNTSLYRPETDAGLLDLLPEKSCIIVFSFYRYALDTIRLAEEAKSKGITVITITDSRVAPVAEYADIVIPITNSHGSLLNKGPVTLSVINEILFKIIQQGEARGKISSHSLKYFIKAKEYDG